MDKLYREFVRRERPMKLLLETNTWHRVAIRFPFNPKNGDVYCGHTYRSFYKAWHCGTYENVFYYKRKFGVRPAHRIFSEIGKKVKTRWIVQITVETTKKHEIEQWEQFMHELGREVVADMKRTQKVIKYSANEVREMFGSRRSKKQ